MHSVVGRFRFTQSWALHLRVAVTLTTASAILLALGHSPVSAPIDPSPDKVGPFDGGSSYFVPNAGQADAVVKYQALGLSGVVYFTLAGVQLVWPADIQPQLHVEAPKAHSTTAFSVGLVFEGANPSPEVRGKNALPGIVNFLVGNDPSNWRTHLPAYTNLEYRQLYPGIDLDFSGSRASLKGTYQVAPGADPARIRWRYEGASSLNLAANGDLQIEIASTAGSRTLVEHAPVAWQVINGQQRPVSVQYHLTPDNIISMTFGDYDRHEGLVIDPTLVFSTYLGGSQDDSGEGIALDASNNIYVTGYTASGNGNVFVTKIQPGGSGWVYTTYLGSSSYDVGTTITVDNLGQAYVAGYTEGTDFPVVNAFQPLFGGGPDDAFLVKLSADGTSPVYSTYLGGDARDRVESDIVRDSTGNVYLAGSTRSSDFPTANALQANFQGGTFDAFVTKFNADGSALIYSTYFGGGDEDRGFGLAVDAAGYACLTGHIASAGLSFPHPFDGTFNGLQDAYLIKLVPSGDQLEYGTYLGGLGVEGGLAVTVDGLGNVYVLGKTRSLDFPVVDPFQANCALDPNGFCSDDMFLTKFQSDGQALIFSSFLGGNWADRGDGLALDSNHNIYGVGVSDATNFPLVNPIQNSNQGSPDVVAFAVAADGSALLFSTYLGGSGYDDGVGLALDSLGRMYITGMTESANFPLANPLDNTRSGSTDAYVAIINVGLPTATPTRTPTSTATPSVTPTSTSTPSPTLTPTSTQTQSPSPSPSPSSSPSPTPTPPPLFRLYLAVIRS